MKKGYYWRLVVNAIRVICKKIIFGSNVDISLIQLWGKRQEFIISNNGHIKIGRKLTSRSDLHLNSLGGTLAIGNNVFCNYNVSVTALESVIIEDDVTIANNVVIVDHDHTMNAKAGRFTCKPVRICRGAWIGANSVILKGVIIGESAIVAAGSVVTKSVSAHSLVAGIPAKTIDHGESRIKGDS